MDIFFVYFPYKTMSMDSSSLLKAFSPGDFYRTWPMFSYTKKTKKKKDLLFQTPNILDIHKNMSRFGITNSRRSFQKITSRCLQGFQKRKNASLLLAAPRIFALSKSLAASMGDFLLSATKGGVTWSFLLKSFYGLFKGLL